MRDHVFSTLRFLVGGALIAVAFINIWQANKSLSYLKARENDDVVVWENRLVGVRNALLGVRYSGGDVGFISANSLRGDTRTAREDVNWVQARYVMIPWNLLQETVAAPFVIVDSSESRSVEPVPVPPGFVELYDSKKGLVLLQRTKSP